MSTETTDQTGITDNVTAITTNRPTNVIAALARVEEEIGGISKLSPREHAARRGQQQAESGISYSYRGIDQIAQAAQPLLGRYGIVIVPTVLNHVVDDITVNNRPWTDTTVTVQWDIYGPAGIPDKITATTIGYGRDNSDKGMNKAMTGAYKNLLLRILSIGDPQDDTDHERHETDNPNQPTIHKDPRVLTAFNRLSELNDQQKQDVRQLAEAYGEHLTERALAENPDWLNTIEMFITVNLDQPTPATEQLATDTTLEHRQQIAQQKLEDAGLTQPDPETDNPNPQPE